MEGLGQEGKRAEGKVWLEYCVHLPMKGIDDCGLLLANDCR